MQGEQSLLGWLLERRYTRVWIPGPDGKGPFTEVIGGAILRSDIEAEIQRLMERELVR